MMTRTTLKALWFGGGGILATWLAVSPNHGGPSMHSETAARPPAASSQPTGEDLNALATRLRERSEAVTLRPSTRNPFRYNSRKDAPPSGVPAEPAVQPTVASAMSTSPPAVLTLSGVAQTAGKRTAIISSEGQVYLVGEGDSVAGRYTVVKIDPEAVLLRDASGAEQRLILPQ